MIKRTLYFGNPTYLSLRNEQIVIKLPEVENTDLPESFKKEAIRTIPIEDIGVCIIDHKQITLTHALIEALLDNNVALITCNNQHLPVGLMLPLVGNTMQTERFSVQLSASLPLKKQLWQQTVEQKIINQSSVLASKGGDVKNMRHWADSVKSGDADNHEARAAAYYWANIFPQMPNFTRGREDDFPNNVLNYGYAILRAIVARALVGSGMLPTLGIHHKNKYNPYCLADDVMEPFRPYVDVLVLDIVDTMDVKEVTKEVKAKLLGIPTVDVLINGEKSPLMVGVQRTTASLYRCFSGECRKIAYPKM